MVNPNCHRLFGRDSLNPAPVPLWELEFHAWDAISGRHVVLGHEWERLPAAAHDDALRCNAEIMLAVAGELGFSALTVPNAYWYQAPGQLAYYCLPDEARLRQIEWLRRLAPSDLVLVAAASAVLCADYSEAFCVRMFEAPASVDAQARKLLVWGIGQAAQLRDAGVSAIFTPSDLADNAGPFFNPEQMRRWILPALTEWAAALRGLGLSSILHTDGNVMPYLEMLAATGIDGLQAIDPVAGMDMRQALDQVGNRLCLCGNVDCGLLLRGRPSEVYAATRALLLDCRGRGQMVLGASNAIQPDVPPANYRAMIQAWRELWGGT